jgi:putative nucleotidyltransferase-like protein
MRRITAEEEIMLLCAGTERRRRSQAEHARTIASRADWDRLLRLLWRQRMLPLGAARLEELLGERVPDRFVAAAADAREIARGLAFHNELATRTVLDTLAEGGLDALPLKGSVLATALYEDPGLRAAGDVDVLVHPSTLDSACACLAAVGYRQAQGPNRRPLPLLHRRLVHAEGLSDVELHWRVHWYEERFSADMLAEARARGDSRAARARPEWEYASLLLFWARDGFAGLRLAADVASWWDRHGHELPSESVPRMGERYPALRRVLDTASLQAQRVCGVPAPSAARASPRRRIPAAARLADWRLDGSDEQIAADAALVDLLLSPPGGRAAYIRRQLLLEGEVLVERDPTLGSLPRWRVEAARWLHLLRLSARCAAAAWRIRGGRETGQLPGWVT